MDEMLIFGMFLGNFVLRGGKTAVPAALLAPDEGEFNPLHQQDSFQDLSDPGCLNYY